MTVAKPDPEKRRLLTREDRRAEFARLQETGIKGVKVDFFPGDGQSTIQYYRDILKDAADKEATHSAMLPFTRNLFDPMDFTPMVLGDIPNIERKTSNGFQLALPVLFYSGIMPFSAWPRAARDFMANGARSPQLR